MSIEILKSNILREKELIEKIITFIEKSENADEKTKKIFEKSIDSYKNQIRILNDSLPELIKNAFLDDNKSNEIINVNHKGLEGYVGIKRKDKEKYLNQLNISDVSFSMLKKQRKKHIEKENEYKSPNPYVSLSNKFFLKFSNNFIDKGYFRRLEVSLKKGGFIFLIDSYVSMMFFTTFLAFILGIFSFLFFFFFSINFSSPFIYLVDLQDIDIFSRLLMTFWMVVFFPLVTYFIILYYPSTEKSSIESQIDYELPFVTIQMSAISGADIEPSNIFRIISLSKEYPHIRKESKKLMNQINLYGYDLVTALRNVASSSPSKNWAELLNGIANTIKSGGDLSKFFSKRAETLLFEYRIKREKATKSAETFMDIYISVVIAAPMLMMLLLVMIIISGIGLSLTVTMLTIIIVSIVAVINLIFLTFLHLNQKKF